MVVATAATLLVAAAASLFMAWSIGAGSSGSTPFAPAVGANAISVMRAGLVVGVLGLLGAILQGANVTEAVGTELIGGVTLTAVAAIVALVTAAALVAVGVFAGYPIATAFTVTGAVVGAGLAMGGEPAVAKYYEILSVWTLTPFVGGGVAFGTAKFLRHEAVPERFATPALAGSVGAILANVEFVLLGPSGVAQSIAGTIAPDMTARIAVTLLFALLVAIALGMDMHVERNAHLCQLLAKSGRQPLRLVGQARRAIHAERQAIRETRFGQERPRAIPVHPQPVVRPGAKVVRADESAQRARRTVHHRFDDRIAVHRKAQRATDTAIG